VPHHSARIQLCAEAMHDPRHGPAFVTMVHNLLAPLGCDSILHVEARSPWHACGEASSPHAPPPFASACRTMRQVCFSHPPAKRISQQLDAAIGRFAHIAYLEQQEFIQMFTLCYLPYLV